VNDGFLNTTTGIADGVSNVTITNNTIGTRPGRARNEPGQRRR
jgi:hypothetical protein